MITTRRGARDSHTPKSRLGFLLKGYYLSRAPVRVVRIQGDVRRYSDCIFRQFQRERVPPYSIRRMSCRKRQGFALTSSTPTPTRCSTLSHFRLPFPRVPTGRFPPQTCFTRSSLSVARPERRPLLTATAIGLLLVSTSVSLRIPSRVAKLIDYRYFTSSNSVA